jgi:hypothetical protein
LWVLQRSLFEALTAALGIPTQLSALGLILGLSPVIVGVLVHHLTHLYEIDDGRMIRATEGFIRRTWREFSVSDQVQIDLEQTIAGRLLGYGTVTFWTGDVQSRLAWRNVADPVGLAARVRSLGSGGHAARPPSTAAPASTSIGAAVPIRPATATGPTLAEARKLKRTWFRSEGAVDAPSTTERVVTPVGTYIDNGDGTITHAETGLRIIRAPWGMTWNGAGFQGEPIKLTWDEATRLFGRGAAVPYEVGGTMARFGKGKREASVFRHGYDRGRCVVDFAGCHDWRLATAEELQRMSASLDPMDESGGAEGLATRDERYAWAWRGESSWPIVQRLYPEFAARLPHLWSATGLGSGLAWAFDGSFPVGDHEASDPRGLMFVRQDSVS